MEFNPETRQFSITTEEQAILELDSDIVGEDSAFDILVDAAMRRDRFLNARVEVMSSDFGGARLQTKLSSITDKIRILDDIIEVVGSNISLESSIAEIEDAANGTNQ